MLKLSFHLKSNIIGRNTNARLFRFYRRLNFFVSLFFNSKYANCAKNIKPVIRYTKKKFNNKITLMRSPFHYKTSKTLLSAPHQQSIIDFYIPVLVADLLILNDLANLPSSLNQSQNLCITKIKISSIEC